MVMAIRNRRVSYYLMKLTMQKSQKVRLAGSHERRAKAGVILLAVTMIGVTTLLVSFAATGNGPNGIDVPLCGTVRSPATCANGQIAFRKGASVALGQLNKNTNVKYDELKTKTAAELTATLSTNGLLVGGTPQSDFRSNHNPANNYRIGGQFRTFCQFSHLSYDDPIIFPGQPGKSHLHMFFGNTDTNANSTIKSIINTGGSTCDGGPLNRTSYWTPALLDTAGKVRIPNSVILYYKNEGVSMPYSPIDGYSAVPPGLKMLGGDPKAMTPRKNGFSDGWGCGENMFRNPDSYNALAAANNRPWAGKVLIPTCPLADYVSGSTVLKRNKLTQKLLFPRCWDGVVPNVNDDTLQPYVVHVLFPNDSGNCDPAYPYVLPEITILMEWTLAAGETTTGWKLSSDSMTMPDGTKMELPGGTSSHGDYFAGWNKTIVDSWTTRCLNTEWNCQTAIISNLKGSEGTPGGALPGGEYNYLRYTNFDQFDNKGAIVIPDITKKLLEYTGVK